MGQTTNTPEMAEPVKMVKITVKEYDRLKKFGYAGESINTALKKVLDIAEQVEKKK
jgi:hypothetical protein